MAGFELNYDVRTSAPTVAQFHRSDADFKAIKGPIGSGKSVACCIEVFRRCQEQKVGPDGFRRSRWAVVRNCYDDQTEILTEERGWVLFKDLTPTDRVASKVDGELRFVTPAYYHAAPYTGRMITLIGEGMDLCVTPDHELWVSPRRTRKKIWFPYEHIKAQDIEGIGELYRMSTTCDWEGQKCNYSVDWFEFLGFWFAQGYAGVYPRTDTAGEHYRLTLTHRETDFDYVTDLLDRVGLEYGLHKKQGCFDFRIRTTDEDVKEIIRELAGYGKARTKCVPQYVKDAPAEHIRAFVYGFQKGDGVFKTGKHEVDRLYSSSFQLINDLHELVIKTGRSAYMSTASYGGVCKVGDAPEYKSSECYMLTIKQPLRDDPIIRKHFWGETQYDGMVYCVTVPGHVVLVRRNGKAVWCGQTKQQLKDTTLKTWFDWFPSDPSGNGVGYWKETDATYYLEFGDVKAEIMFRALDTPADVAKVLSLELTGVWLNECREIVQEIVEGLQGRLERYPSKKMGGSNYWMMIADTNPPQEGSYWWKIFEHVPLEDDDPESVVDCDTFSQPSGISPEAENLPNLEGGYYTRKAKGRSKEYINVFIKAKYASSLAGKPVYHDSFRYNRHVSRKPLPIHPTLPIIVGQDFGLTPAGLWMQMQEDGRIFILRETPAFDMGIKRYIKSKFNPMRRTTFPLNPIIVVGDPSGTRRSQSDENDCYKEFKKAGIMAKKASTNDPVVRIKVFDDLFSEYPDMQPMVLIDPACRTFISAMRLDYKYRRIKNSIVDLFDEKPDKTHPCSHLVEGGQYGAMFLTSRKYDPADFVVYDEFDPLQMQGQAYRPAQSTEGY